MRLQIKSFDELNVAQLYEILRVRSEVFVVEQTCVYQDIDGIDTGAVHMWLEEDDGIKAYLRLFYKDETTVQIGRVLTVERGRGLGGQLLHEAVRYGIEDMKAERFYLEAQTYATGFYEKEDFYVDSEPFDEDGIPHVIMRRDA